MDKSSMRESAFYQRINEDEIYVRRIGEGKPILFLHGGPGGEHRFFLPHMTPLADQFELIFYDQRGCGKSTAASGASFTIMQEVEALEILRKELRIDQLNIVGESWGTMLALIYAAKYPENVEKLVLTAAVGSSYEGFGVFEKNLNDRLKIEDRKVLELLSAKFEKGEAELKEIFAVLDPYYVHSPEAAALKTETVSNASVNEEMGKAIRESYDLRGKLSHISHIPILILQGESDLISPLELEELLLKDLPHAEMKVIPESGHWTIVEKPLEVMNHIRHFFQ
ncbi:alpha/beta fold hydrolase [Falsibacillus pallidus]|uniref:alpha/beta fold hydrolase n=1 Tax=Falsibacillus pallidus TaxID=493781 RepID=UPI003D96450D